MGAYISQYDSFARDVGACNISQLDPNLSRHHPVYAIDPDIWKPSSLRNHS
jgi:hypothetical protein